MRKSTVIRRALPQYVDKKFLGRRTSYFRNLEFMAKSGRKPDILVYHRFQERKRNIFSCLFIWKQFSMF